MSQMKFIICLVAFITSLRVCLTANGHSTQNSYEPHKRVKRVYGGEPTTIDKAPYLATLMDYYDCALESFGEPICGASIITQQWLITAAHCLVDRNRNRTKIRTGATGRYCGKQYRIKRFVIHPNFTKQHFTIANDIGLIKLAEPLMKITGKQRPIPLLKSTCTLAVGTKLEIFGFGRVGENLEGSQEIKTATLPIVDLETCRNAYGKFDPISDKMICAGNGDSSCNGDSGGPAVINGRLAGIVSSGFMCDTTYIPAVFTAVSKYIDWINKYVN